jgi:cysteine desulfurase
MTRPPSIYLDYAATTPLSAEVVQGMHQALQAATFGINPASQHTAGRAWRKTLEMERELIAALLGAKTEGMHADRVVFTSGGTEANNLALFGLAGCSPCRVLVSAIEHPSVMMAADELTRRGCQVEKIAVGQDGVLDLAHLRSLLEQDPIPKLVSVMRGNNETGVLQPIPDVAEVCHERDSLLHTDAVQSVGKSSWGFAELHADAMTVAAHKFYGPVGIGALLLHHDTRIEPQLFGGFQQGGIRPGTESFPLVVGFRDALQNVVEDTTHAANIGHLRDRFEQALREHLNDLVINGAAAERLPHISNVAFLGCDRQQLFLALDFAGVYCSTGSACASGSSEPSPVLRAMGLPEEVISSSLRFSFGSPTTRDEIDEAVERIVKCVNKLRSQKSARK